MQGAQQQCSAVDWSVRTSSFLLLSGRLRATGLRALGFAGNGSSPSFLYLLWQLRVCWFTIVAISPASFSRFCSVERFRPVISSVLLTDWAFKAPKWFFDSGESGLGFVVLNRHYFQFNVICYSVALFATCELSSGEEVPKLKAELTGKLRICELDGEFVFVTSSICFPIMRFWAFQQFVGTAQVLFVWNICNLSVLSLNTENIWTVRPPQLSSFVIELSLLLILLASSSIELFCLMLSVCSCYLLFFL